MLEFLNEKFYLNLFIFTFRKHFKWFSQNTLNINSKLFFSTSHISQNRHETTFFFRRIRQLRSMACFLFALWIAICHLPVNSLQCMRFSPSQINALDTFYMCNSCWTKNDEWEKPERNAQQRFIDCNSQENAQFPFIAF